MRLETTVHDAANAALQGARRDADAETRRIEPIVDGGRRPMSAPNRVLLESGRFWSGYRVELMRIPSIGILERVSSPHPDGRGVRHVRGHPITAAAAPTIRQASTVKSKRKTT